MLQELGLGARSGQGKTAVCALENRWGRGESRCSRELGPNATPGTNQSGVRRKWGQQTKTMNRRQLLVKRQRRRGQKLKGRVDSGEVDCSVVNTAGAWACVRSWNVDQSVTFFFFFFFLSETPATQFFRNERCFLPLKKILHWQRLEY